MKPLLGWFCVAVLLFTAPYSFANDMKLPERKPVYQQVSVDHQKLNEARFLLEQISLGLKEPDSSGTARPSEASPALPVKPQAPHTSVEELQISRQGDLNMGCGALSQEAMRMRDIVYTTQDIKDRAKMQSQGITAAGAIGSFLVGSVTGGVGLAIGGFLLDHNVDQNADDADHVQDIAEQRRTLMMGIYNAKGCEGPLEHAMQNPEIFDPLSQLAAIETAAGKNGVTGYNN